jgi:hypothetical protein
MLFMHTTAPARPRNPIKKARTQGFNDFWTIIAKKGLSLETLRSESPSTNRWFDVSQVLGRTGEDWGFAGAWLLPSGFLSQIELIRLSSRFWASEAYLLSHGRAHESKT